MIDYHFMIPFSLIVFLGMQIFIVGIYGKTYALSQGNVGLDPIFAWGRKWLTLEKGILIGFLIFSLGSTIALYVLIRWLSSNFSFQNDDAAMIRQAILSMSMMISGIQIISAAVLLGLFPLSKSQIASVETP